MIKIHKWMRFGKSFCGIDSYKIEIKIVVINNKVTCSDCLKSVLRKYLSTSYNYKTAQKQLKKLQYKQEFEELINEL